MATTARSSSARRRAPEPTPGQPLDFDTAVRRVVKAVPKGTVVTYGEVALEAGFPGAARAVGRVMAGSSGLPWWRVVASNGRLVPGLEAEHERRLRAEGVPLTASGKVAMTRRA